VAVFVGGNREHGFVIACDHRTYRFKPVASGEMAIYTDDGSHIHLKKSGQVEVKAATKLTVDVPNSEFKGNLKVTGKVEVTGNVETQAKVTAVGNVESSAKVKGLTGLETMADVAYGPGAASSVTALKTGFNTHTHLAGVIPVPDSPVLP
jgi:phage gp45-like